MLKLTAKWPGALRGFKLVLTIIVVATGISALRLAFNLGYFFHVFRCSRLANLNCYLSFEGSVFLLVTAALILSTIGLSTRRRLGFLISFLAFAWVFEIYREWYVATLSIMQAYGAKTFSALQDQQQYFLPLAGANWWDIVVLAVALSVFTWHITMLGRVLKPFSKSLREPIRRRINLRRKELRVTTPELEQQIE
jgi:hypothetical protein